MDAQKFESMWGLIRRRRHIVLSENAAETFFATLDAPAEPVAELVELFSRPRALN